MAIAPKDRLTFALSVRFVFYHVCAYAVAAMLLISAFSHLDNPYAFLNTIYSYRLVSASWGLIGAAVIPFLQLSLALFILFFEPFRRAALVLTAVLFLGFVGVQLSAVFRELNISCDCFGPSNTNPIGTKSITVAAVGFVLALSARFAIRGNRTCEPQLLETAV